MGSTTAPGRAAPRAVDTVVIGGGQAGLSVGRHLSRLDQDVVILDASDRIGGAWRARWDSLRLFTPNRLNGLDGMPFPGDPYAFPTKDEFADYLATYAEAFDLPVQSGTRVESLARGDDGRFVVTTGRGDWLADQVVVAMGSHQRPRVPDVATELGDDLVQLHSAHYTSPADLPDGPVLVVGAANSGVEIAMDLVATHEVVLAGAHPGHIPFDVDARRNQWLVRLVLRGLFHRVLSLDTPIGRRARPRLLHHAAELVRTSPRQVRAAGVQRLARVEGSRDGMPVDADGRRPEVGTVVWATGYRSGLSSWVDLPVLDPWEEPRHERGVSTDEPGLFFVGRHFQRAASSGQIHGVGRDAADIAARVAAGSERSRRRRRPASASAPT